MLTLPSHPKPVPGAARYWAAGKEVYMRDTEGYVSCIQTRRTEGQALDSAKAWQVKENKVVTREAAKAK